MKSNYIDHIKTLFLGIQPEHVIHDIKLLYKTSKKSDDIVTAYGCSEQIYRKAASIFDTNKSEDEIMQSYNVFRELISNKRKQQDRCNVIDEELNRNNSHSVLYLLALYAKEALLFDKKYPLCKQEDILNFRAIYIDMGQDIFTCSGLAAFDLEKSIKRLDFTWAACIRTDNIQLNALYDKGIAENHYHLKGSTQCFSLAWGYLMNYPDKAKEYFKNKSFMYNLSGSNIYGVADAPMSWDQRIIYAAYIRCVLFEKIVRNDCDYKDYDLKKLDELLVAAPYVARKAAALRLMYGCSFLQKEGNSSVLDYAITKDFPEECLNKTERFLAGERFFLYSCFKLIFSNQMNEYECNLFYIYILLKLKFRSELIQTNQKYGFRNFFDYQERKDVGWEESSAYFAEAIRLSICNSIMNSVDSLEARIAPKMKDKLIKQTSEYEKLVKLGLNIKNDMDSSTPEMAVYNNADLFYVISFPKIPLKVPRKENSFIQRERQYERRKEITKYSRELFLALKSNKYLDSMIRGIDACSLEIGSRPEIFAPDFRFLKNCIYQRNRAILGNDIEYLNFTYHVGEDFLDVADGLRATDEAIKFFNMKRNDRIGHGLALGIDPYQFYKLKKFSINLPKQDLLDNLVWILNISKQNNINLSWSLQRKLEDKASQLISHIYGTNRQINILNYYNSWLLRGDAPVLYRAIDDLESMERYEKCISYDCNSQAYYYANENIDDIDLYELRRRPIIRELMFGYQFDYSALCKGQEVDTFFVEDEYICVIKELQEVLLNRIERKGICVECNPSSNYLIGTFREYQKHPIFRFNSSGLSHKMDGCHEIKVSINTDDIGVFDTTLENEYALLYCAMSNAKDEEGNKLYGDYEIMNYLEHIRSNGYEMKFTE